MQQPFPIAGQSQQSRQEQALGKKNKAFGRNVEGYALKEGELKKIQGIILILSFPQTIKDPE